MSIKPITSRLAPSNCVIFEFEEHAFDFLPEHYRTRNGEEYGIAGVKTSKPIMAVSLSCYTKYMRLSFKRLS